MFVASVATGVAVLKRAEEPKVGLLKLERLRVERLVVVVIVAVVGIGGGVGVGFICCCCPRKPVSSVIVRNVENLYLTCLQARPQIHSVIRLQESYGSKIRFSSERATFSPKSLLSIIINPNPKSAMLSALAWGKTNPSKKLGSSKTGRNLSQRARRIPRSQLLGSV